MKKLIVTITLLFMATAAQANMWPGLASDLSADCPRQIDSITTLISVSPIENGLVYMARIEAARSDLTAEEWVYVLDEIKRMARNSVLTDPVMSVFVKIEADIIYKYYDRNGLYLGEVVLLEGGK